jgi:hypothetical protein
MKKEYIIPAIEIVSSQLEQAMMGFSDDWADAKENSFEDEDASDLFKETAPHNLWEDAEDED